MDHPFLPLILTCLMAFTMHEASAQQGQGAGSIPPPQIARADMNVGVFYFPGWSEAQRWYCIKASETAQHPLLGYYREGNPVAADWHIKWALEHGVSFFAFDYYMLKGDECLESALGGLMESRFVDQFKFCLNWCNHAAPETQTREEFDEFRKLVVGKYLTHPSHLRIGNKPVVIILSGYSFVKTLGVDGAKQAFDALDEDCRKAGLDGVHLVFCEGNILKAEHVKESLAAGADAFCLYNYPYAGTDVRGPDRQAEESYEHLINQAPGLWKHWEALTEGAFWPTVMPGWDRRPWTKDHDLVRTGSTPELFARSLREAREHVNADQIVMIEAWNEWGEGSVLEPSVECGFGYLDKVREVFCPEAGEHEDADPAGLGLPMPEFTFELPATDLWGFDFGIDGWSGNSLRDLQHSHGSMVGVATTGDPQFVGPPTYLRCEEYGTLRVRMRLTPSAEDAPESSTAQLFWSTVEWSFAEATSIAFPVTLDGEWHEYEADLSSRPRWSGLTDRVRFDPVTIADVTIEVDRLQFVRGR